MCVCVCVCVCLLHPSGFEWQALKEKKSILQPECTQPGALGPSGDLGQKFWGGDGTP